MKNIEVGKIYAYDIDNMISTCHMGTYTVKALSVHERHIPKASMCFDDDYDDGFPISPLIECESVQTGEEFDCDAGHLTEIPVVLKIYKAAKEELCEYEGIDHDIIEKKINRMAKILQKSFVQFNKIET